MSVHIEKQRLFVDMDGTLAEFKHVDTLETLYERGYFFNLKPMDNVVDAIKHMIKNNPEIDVNILSAYLAGNPYAITEKNQWLDQYLPEVDAAHRVFSPCGCDKKDFIPGGIRETDCLLDDYTHNLRLWQPPARGIKLLNGINHTRGTWEHDRIRYDKKPAEIASDIVRIMKTTEMIRDEKPNDPKTIEDYEKLGIYNVDQLMEIRWGLEDGFDVSSYANPEYNARQMESRRLALLSGNPIQHDEEIEPEWDYER
ncbi:5' nucleotidase, NT5C type [Desulfitobacterium chlororespirans]|uniref:5' nucleotidase, deoxy (Pyrimidine), type C protein (NT5C) n=1 Tax=Desulfitobacterium chlororespirans DSM 11544 TaxID=1121395 RepID=A0A1M7UYC8_9FIRM|nr:hypothetical protein [Desulfitobacterium chlororespirans]SHN87942.1 5' nucleotidase, deoxy (Pyrimidine), type C protein (NT5C) [Desulfitobacterium chlororespirans DSM 11544]